MKTYQERVAERMRVIRETPHITTDWERQRQLDEMIADEKFGQFARPHRSHREPAEPSVTIQVRSLYTPDWSENHEA